MGEVKFEACQKLLTYVGCPSGSFSALLGQECGVAETVHCEEGNTRMEALENLNNVIEGRRTKGVPEVFVKRTWLQRIVLMLKGVAY